MFGKATLSLVSASVGIYGLWQLGNIEKPLARFLTSNFTLGEAATMQDKKVQTVLLYPLCHSSLVHLASNIAVYLTIGATVERLEGAAMLAKLGIIAAPLGFVFAYSLSGSKNTSTSTLQSTRGGGCLSTALAVYYMAGYPKHQFSLQGRRIPGKALASALIACECAVSHYWAGNSSLDPELGGAVAAAYFIFARKVLRG